MKYQSRLKKEESTKPSGFQQVIGTILMVVFLSLGYIFLYVSKIVSFIPTQLYSLFSSIGNKATLWRKHNVNWNGSKK